MQYCFSNSLLNQDVEFLGPVRWMFIENQQLYDSVDSLSENLYMSTKQGRATHENWWGGGVLAEGETEN